MTGGDDLVGDGGQGGGGVDVRRAELIGERRLLHALPEHFGHAVENTTEYSLPLPSYIDAISSPGAKLVHRGVRVIFPTDCAERAIMGTWSTTATAT